ncbi:putative reverse transcriptase domain-containing protein [Tanacetum coccineum]
MLAADHIRQEQLTKALKLIKRLQTQIEEIERQQGPAKGPAQPELQAEAGSSSWILLWLAMIDANTNGVDNHNSRTGARRNERATRECTYPDFMKCQSLNFKGTEGFVDLTQWIEKMETVFCISNYSVEHQIKFSTCTLLGNALTWWNSHVRTVGNDIAYTMTWAELKKKMTDKYCPRTEIMKLESTITNCYPLPRIDDLFDQLHGSYDFYVFIVSNGGALDDLRLNWSGRSLWLGGGDGLGVAWLWVDDVVKNKTYDWDEEQEEAFQILKDKLCNAHVLALSDGPEDFVVYCDASGLGLGCVQMQRGKRIDLARYTGAERNTREVLTQSLVLIEEDNFCYQMERKSDGVWYYLDRIWVPLMGDVRTLIMDEAHKSKDMYWWPRMKKYIALYVSKCLTCLKIKAEHQSPSGSLQQHKIPEWKWERIAMDFVTKLLRTSSGHDAIWVIIDRLTKSAHFLPMREDIRRIGTRLDMSTTYHPQTDDQCKRTIQTLKDMLQSMRYGLRGSWNVHLPLVDFSYNNSYHSSVRCVLFEALYRRKCRSPILWEEVREGQLIGLEIMQETTNKISQIKDRLKTARDRQKSYADKMKKPLEFSVGNHASRGKRANTTTGKVYSDLKITFVNEVVVDELFECGFLKSITVTRADKKRYAFKESNFSRLNLNDIEDMYVLKAQGN